MAGPAAVCAAGFGHLGGTRRLRPRNQAYGVRTCSVALGAMPRFRTCRVAPAVLLLLGVQFSQLELGHAAALDHEAAPSWDPADPHADHYQAALAFEKAGDDDAALQVQ